MVQPLKIIPRQLISPKPIFMVRKRNLTTPFQSIYKLGKSLRVWWYKIGDRLANQSIKTMNSTPESKMLSQTLRDVAEGHTHFKYSNRIPAKNTREDTTLLLLVNVLFMNFGARVLPFVKKQYGIFVQEKDAVIFQYLFLIPCYGLTCVSSKFIG